MKEIHIINNLYLNRDGKALSVGGVETYLNNLSKIMLEVGITPVIYQQANEDFECTFDGVKVIGIRESLKKFTKKALTMIPAGEIVMFANDEIVFGKYDGTVIALQHGIGWDLPAHKERGRFFDVIYYVLSLKKTFRRIRNARAADVVVCVDYNYVNWFRTQVNNPKANFKVIPNFSVLPEDKPIKGNDKINVIFARRFVDYRGTKYFTNAIKKVMDQHSNVFVTFAGKGPDEDWIRNELCGYTNFEIISYPCGESLKVHANKHIAVVPSLGSEGTSLSLLEAMASGCAVVCTNVGGMTNIVIDGYNGLMADITGDSLYEAINELVVNADLRNRISEKAYETVAEGFSYKKWAQAWIKILNEVTEKQ